MTLTADQIKNKSSKSPDDKILELKRQIEHQENIKLLRKLTDSPAGGRIRRAMNLLKWITQREGNKGIDPALAKVADKTLQTLVKELCSATGVTSAGLEGPAKGRHAEEPVDDLEKISVSGGGFEDLPDDEDDEMDD